LQPAVDEALWAAAAAADIRADQRTASSTAS
jgi:hypothetical protein